MKISQDVIAKADHRTHTQTPDSKHNFGKMVITETKQLQQRELSALIDDITTVGERLAKCRSFKDLAKFKRMIKQFLETAVNQGLTVKEERHFHQQRVGHFTTVQKIDEKLIELTEDMLHQEKSSVDLLGVIGEIRGLLVNIYT